MKVADIEFKDQRALSLVVDTALLLEVANTDAGRWHGRTFARAAIINVVLLLECCANSCLYSLELPGKLLEELDKLSVLSKLDYYLFACTRRHLERGSREVELAGEVMKLRNHLVHPKQRSGKLSGEGATEFVDYGTTEAMGIPFDVREWDHLVAEKVASAVLSFLGKFFLEWCGMSKSRVTSLLTSRERALIQGATESYVRIPDTEHKVVRLHLPGALEILDLRA